MEIPGLVAPARSGLPPLGLVERGRSEVGLSERGRSEELLCGREVDLAAEGRPEDGLPLEEVPDDPDGLPLDGRADDGRDDPALEGGRRDSMSFNSIPSENIFLLQL